MIKVLIIDDDNLVRKYLAQVIDWEKEGYEILAAAANGEQALAIIEEHDPDVILTDISMPVMDGITFIKKMRSEGNIAPIAVLSCHDEFEYVKEAMRLGANEYVLKNTLDAESLKTLLCTLCGALLQKETEQEEKERLIALAKRGSQTIVQETIMKLKDTFVSFEEQKDILQKNDISASFYRCACLMIIPTEADILTFQKISLPKNALKVQAEQIILLLDLSDIASAREQAEKLHQFTQQIEEKRDRQSLIGISDICMGDGSIKNAIYQADIASQMAFYKAGECIYHPAFMLREQMPEKAREFHLRLSNLEEAPENLKAEYTEIISAVKKEPVKLEVMLSWVAEIDEACGQTWLEMPRQVKDCDARFGFYERFLSNKMQKKTLSSENPIVTQAIHYIEAHYTEPISLSEVANAVSLNPTYLSFVFKRDSGRNFLEYLQSLRLEEAKRLLKTTNRAIKDISQAVGFMDYRHFCKLFKKETDYRPIDYRKSAT